MWLFQVDIKVDKDWLQNILTIEDNPCHIHTLFGMTLKVAQNSDHDHHTRTDFFGHIRGPMFQENSWE
jgi:hypothetical protein